MASLQASTLSARLQSLANTATTRPRNAAVTSAVVTLAVSLAWVLNDFRAWKSFGTGGTPPTWARYWRMTKIRVNRLLLFGKDDLADPSPLSTDTTSYLKADVIPERHGPRPSNSSWTMPQRQAPYKKGTVEPRVEDTVKNMMATLATRHSDLLELRPSKTEGGSTDAIYAKASLPNLNPETQTQKALGTEIAHAHPAEGSLHVWLSQADAKLVVEKGWGLRFPLAFVSKGWTMVYAPRTMAEVDVVERIVKAGIAWVSGVEV